MRISLGYPDRAAERELLPAPTGASMVEATARTLTPVDLQALQQNGCCRSMPPSRC